MHDFLLLTTRISNLASRQIWFINGQFHRAWMKFVDRFYRNIQCLVQIAIDPSSENYSINRMLIYLIDCITTDGTPLISFPLVLYSQSVDL
jgi:hypothetical protein